MNQFHITDIVEVDLVFEYDRQSFSIELDAQDRSWKREFANGGVPLLHISQEAQDHIAKAAEPLCL